MTQVFEEYESNFYTNLRDAQKLIKTTNPTPATLQQASESIKEASQQLNKMEIQYNNNREPQMKSKIEVFKQQIRNFKKDLSKLENQLQEEQAEQNSGPLFDNEGQEKGINPLIEAKRQMYENQHMANEAATGLKRNNEILMKNINRMGDINNELTVAHKLLNSIKNKLRKNKLIMFGTLAFLFLVLVVIIYSYVRGSSTVTVIDTNTKGSG